MKVIKPKKIIEKITNKKTGEEYKDDTEWKARISQKKTSEEM